MIPPITDWPADLRDQYHERLAIMLADSVPDAERLALEDTWRQRDRVHRPVGPRLRL